LGNYVKDRVNLLRGYSRKVPEPQASRASRYS
jgi:hypothetical protein